MSYGKKLTDTTGDVEMRYPPDRERWEEVIMLTTWLNMSHAERAYKGIIRYRAKNHRRIWRLSAIPWCELEGKTWEDYNGERREHVS